MMTEAIPTSEKLARSLGVKIVSVEDDDHAIIVTLSGPNRAILADDTGDEHCGVGVAVEIGKERHFRQPGLMGSPSLFQVDADGKIPQALHEVQALAASSDRTFMCRYRITGEL